MNWHNLGGLAPAKSMCMSMAEMTCRSAASAIIRRTKFMNETMEDYPKSMGIRVPEAVWIRKFSVWRSPAPVT